MGSHVALVKGNRQMGFQVDRATHIFWVLVQGDRPMGSHTKKKKKRERRK
jgi:hypothetical protein